MRGRFLARFFEGTDRFKIDFRSGPCCLPGRASAPPQRAWYFSGGSDGSAIRIRQPQIWQTMKSPSRWKWQRVLLCGAGRSGAGRDRRSNILADKSTDAAD